MNTLGDELKQLRKKRKLTQKELSDVLNIKRATLANWETGRSIPDIAMIKRIADFFDITVDFLLFGDSHESVINKAIPINDFHVLEVLNKKDRIDKEQLQFINDTMGDSLLGLLPDNDMDFFLKPTNREKFLKLYRLDELGIKEDEILEAALKAYSDFMSMDDDKLFKDSQPIPWDKIIQMADEIGVTTDQLHCILRIIKQVKGR